MKNISIFIGGVILGYLIKNKAKKTELLELRSKARLSALNTSTDIGGEYNLTINSEKPILVRNKGKNGINYDIDIPAFVNEDFVKAKIGAMPKTF
jgi:hypothetical protein